MDNQAILTKAINQAIDGGWEPGSLELIFKNLDLPYRYNKRGDQYAPMFIFNHDFAKAIAGDDWTRFLCDLVVEPEPIKELEKWL